ncbi:hypothetical protein Tco_0300283 [Tanacetum coccineum]
MNVNVEESYSKAMLAIDGTGFDWSYMADEKAATNFALMAFSDYEACLHPLVLIFILRNEKFKQPEFEGYGVKVNKGASENVSKEVKKTSDAPIIEDWVSDCDEVRLKKNEQVLLGNKVIMLLSLSILDGDLYKDDNHVYKEYVSFVVFGECRHGYAVSSLMDTAYWSSE